MITDKLNTEHGNGTNTLLPAVAPTLAVSTDSDALDEGGSSGIAIGATTKLSTLSILRKRYPEKEYALMEEVRDKAGFSASRSADFIAVNLWPSRGLHINGIELKSFRSDWLSELKKPEKAENIFQYCDYFWLLTSDDNVAKLDEIPSAWGWLSIKGQKIYVKKEAPKLEPKTFTRHFLCAMLKRATDKTNYVHIDDIADKLQSAKESAKIDKEYQLRQAIKERDEFAKILKEFKESSGIDLESTRWNYGDNNPKKIGEIVKLLQRNGIEEIKKQLLGLENTAKFALDRISETLEKLKANDANV